ncbi:hypothetical protein FOA52_002860 [Chlamydomonas sp. UWO 241]|nr:hypothetical protein FOA52_002860 [Chlamydomonas sp. UWO 241]
MYAYAGNVCAPTGKGRQVQEPSQARLDDSVARLDPCEAEVSNVSCDTYAYYGQEAASPESLSCEERLLSPCGEDADPVGVHDPRRSLRADFEQRPQPQSCDGHASVFDLIRNEAERQHDVRPSASYVTRHPIDESMRGMAVSWLADVVNACNLGRPTLFLAVSYFDRFMSTARDVPPNMLQLAATAAISTAAKQEEVVQPTAAEWTAIADNAFTVEDLARIEWLLIHQLDWRLRTPTACVFLHLLCCHLPALTPKAFQTASYMLELSILDYAMLQHDYSTVAAAGLVAAHRLLGTELDVLGLLSLAPFLSERDVSTCADALLTQHLAGSGATCSE